MTDTGDRKVYSRSGRTPTESIDRSSQFKVTAGSNATRTSINKTTSNVGVAERRYESPSAARNTLRS